MKQKMLEVFICLQWFQSANVDSPGIHISLYISVKYIYLFCIINLYITLLFIAVFRYRATHCDCYIIHFSSHTIFTFLIIILQIKIVWIESLEEAVRGKNVSDFWIVETRRASFSAAATTVCTILHLFSVYV